MNTPDAKAGVGLVGVGAAACAASCAGPILGSLPQPASRLCSVP